VRYKSRGRSLRLVRCGCSQQHYTVRHLAVMAECTCNGHNVDCRPSNSTGSYECVCGGNTTGRYCDACLPLYNQQPFRYGVPCEGLFFGADRLNGYDVFKCRLSAAVQRRRIESSGWMEPHYRSATCTPIQSGSEGLPTLTVLALELLPGG